MGENRGRNTAQWFYETIFQDEIIRPRQSHPIEKLPSPLRAARALDASTTRSWQSRESLFVKQGKLLADYEDDYVYDRPVLHYFPTYQSLTDPELRGYFSWRTKLRHGNILKTSLSYAFLYIYELLNQIGVNNPLDGYRKLEQFRNSYGALDADVLPYLTQWMTDYVIYYGLDPALLVETHWVRFDNALFVMANLENFDQPQILDAVKVLAPKWLERSKFYASYREDMDAVICRVLRGVSAHYAAKCKKTMVEQYFGIWEEFQVRLFDSAVFLFDRAQNRSREYTVDPVRIYSCTNGLWTVRKYGCPERPNAKLNDLMKTIDCVMRQCFEYGHPIKTAVDTKWVLKLIEQETMSLLEEKKAAEAKKITIDFSRLDRIRRDAAVTQEKLIVDEEEMAQEEIPASVEPEAELPDTPLTKEEYRLLQCLLYDRDYSWVRSEGLMMSVLVDSINEKLFDEFADSVLMLDSRPELIEDYIDDLKEMVKP